jgi:DNA-binding NarL/FixJ family response regulator
MQSDQLAAATLGDTSRHFRALSPGERELLAACADGSPHCVVARKLGVTTDTVKARLRRVRSKLHPRPLTPREVEALLMLARPGATRASVAAELGLRFGTVAAHIDSAIINLGARNAREALDMLLGPGRAPLRSLT